MRLPRVEEALTECRRHLAAEGDVGASVRSLLAQAVLILIYAEFDRAIREQLMRRCADIPDPEVRRFVANCVDSVFRSLGIGALAGLLGRFDDEARQEFQRRVDRDTNEKYDSLIRSRNIVAHGDGAAPTLEEVEEYYERAHVVLDHFRYALFARESSENRTPTEAG